MDDTLALAILTFLRNEPGIIKEPATYTNLVTYAFSDKLTVPGQTEVFPTMRLHVVRLTPEFVEQYQSELDYFYQQTDGVGSEYEQDGYVDVWLTTAHLADRGLMMVELSFE